MLLAAEFFRFPRLPWFGLSRERYSRGRFRACPESRLLLPVRWRAFLPKACSTCCINGPADCRQGWQCSGVVREEAGAPR